MLPLCFDPNSVEAGCDEAGRGCLAGPVFAAAVILPNDFSSELLNDSKKHNEANRNLLRGLIEKEALAYAVARVDHEEIDRINILNASIEAMHRALTNLEPQPNHIVVDGNRFKPYKDVPYKTIVKGDGKYQNIAAASILAKTYRDDFMEDLHNQFPVYNWKKNKGYPTVEHRNAVLSHGSSPFHRKSFKVTNPQLRLWS